MAIVMVAMLAFGGTYAYFTDIAEVGEGTFSTGTIDLTAGELGAFSVATLMPGDSSTATGSVTVSATENAYIGLVYTADLGEAGADLTVTLDNKWTKTTSGETTIYVYTNGTSAPVAVTGEQAFTVTATLPWEASNDYQALTDLTITLNAKAVQAKNFATNEGDANLATVAAALVAAADYNAEA